MQKIRDNNRPFFPVKHIFKNDFELDIKEMKLLAKKQSQEYMTDIELLNKVR